MQGDHWDMFCSSWARIGYNAYYEENDCLLQQEEDIAEEDEQ